jgi:hypothetical protein
MATLIERRKMMMSIVGEGLNGHAMEVINMAFGQADGAVVIAATKTYLGSLTQSLAEVLTGLINEDPMFVCSLGLNPTLSNVSAMPIRFLKGDGTAWIETGCTIETADYCKVQVVQRSNASYWSFFGQGASYNSLGAFIYAIAYNTRVNCYIGGKVDFGRDIQTQLNIPFVFEGDCTVVKVTNLSTGVQAQVNSGASSVASTSKTAKLFRGDGSASDLSVVRNWEIGLAQIGSKRDMRPFVRNGVNGMIDLVGETFYTTSSTSGSFTMGYRLPDGTEWTPAT